MIIMIMITIITIIADNDIIPPPHKEQNGFYDFDKYDDYKALFIKIIIIIIVSACPKYFDDYEYDDYGDYDEGSPCQAPQSSVRASTVPTLLSTSPLPCLLL